jgi:hypothetical protein
VCKAGVSREQVIPLYGRGNEKADPRRAAAPGTGTGTGGAAASGGGGDGAAAAGDSAAGGDAGVGASNAGSAPAGGSDDGAVPNRPQAQRPAPPPHEGGGGGFGGGAFGATPGFPGGGFGLGPGVGGPGGVTFSAGFGFFPSLFGLQFQTFGMDRPRGRHPGPLTPDEAHQQMLARLWFAMGVLVILFFLFL